MKNLKKFSLNRKSVKPQWTLSSIYLLVILAMTLSTACSSTPATPIPGFTEVASQPTETQIPTQPEPTFTPLPPPATEAPLPTDIPPTVAPPQTSDEIEGNGVALQLPEPEQGKPALIANTNVNVRTGPGTGYAAYGVLLEGDLAEVTGVSPDNLWWVVNYPAAALGWGWVSAEFVATSNTDDVSVIQPPPVPPTLVFTNPPKDPIPQARIVDSIYLRSGPGEMFPVYGVLPAYETATVIGRTHAGDWWQIRVNSNLVPTQHGWVPAPYVRLRNTRYSPAGRAPANPIIAQLPDPSEGAAAGFPMTPVFLRSGPGLEFPALATTSPSYPAEITGISPNGEWWQVRVPTHVSLDGLAWISAAFLYPFNTADIQVVEPPPAPKLVKPVVPSAGDPGILTTETVNYFAGPGNEWPLLGSLVANAPGVVLGISADGRWYIVRIPKADNPSGQGWVSAEFLEIDIQGGVPIVEPPPK